MGQFSEAALLRTMICFGSLAKCAEVVVMTVGHQDLQLPMLVALNCHGNGRRGARGSVRLCQWTCRRCRDVARAILLAWCMPMPQRCGGMPFVPRFRLNRLVLQGCGACHVAC